MMAIDLNNLPEASKKELLEYCEEHSIEHGKRWTKEQLAQAIAEASMPDNTKLERLECRLRALEAEAKEVRVKIKEMKQTQKMLKKEQTPVYQLRQLYYSRAWPTRKSYMRAALESGLNPATAATYWHKFTRR